ncbi:MAG: phage Gp37/Gp68 family protein [Phycisphaerae bacterium]
MGRTTNIPWTHHTWSPWWGCVKRSPGCDNCYADSLSNRWGFNIWGPDAPRRFFGEHHWNEPRRWNREAQAAGERRRIFPSMCDPFEVRPDLEEPRRRMFKLIEETPWLTWLLLTKRVESVSRLIPPGWAKLWPINCWMIASIEDQSSADLRVPHLLDLPAPVRGLSIEPLVEDLSLAHLWWRSDDGDAEDMRDGTYCAIDWVIVGGESGPKARPMHPAWARRLRDQCIAAGVPFYFKQWGEYIPITPLYQGRDDSAENGCGDLFQVDTHGYIWRDQDGQPNDPRTYLMERVGKKFAGNLLDGRTWEQYPEVKL